jgi:PPK2 family polyphosphate:nucleotide phosphotransferase
MAPLTFHVEPGKKVDLSAYDPRHNAGLAKAKTEAAFPKLAQQIDELQELLFAAGTHSLLVILQGMDTSGKDGTIRSVFSQVDPLGAQTVSFKVPTEEELGHDFLWRVHRQTPQRGQLAIFNRSHYEDVLVVRVHSLVPEAVWKKRYAMINNFEQLLAESNTIILKFFLHISKEEQEQRLLQREQEVEKAWKLAVGDWKERAYWDDYQRAYEEALERCSTDHAPWHIVPADRKWYRNTAIATAVIEALQPYKEIWLAKLASVGEQAKAELAAFRQEKPI